ncbi:DUF421 domain-containing protein [Metabacillus halosaccharovorans]|uniref:DUF421 domain-containing protein n=1 Tax=Metabacillus halosaccharovorans TaxID=930124 RepID=UPI001C20144D|nr:DUF421 domain-containing protein [Metabacillus halosaccharovorans]MBU7594223.1 DUF421 domain-containing protein [Metabacillus halosaccharovorans]
MEEALKDLLIVLGRIMTILPLLLFITIYMGKRTIGQLPIFDFLIVIILGAVVGADIADPEIKHLPTAFTIVMIGVLQKIVTHWKIKNRKFGKFITFEPTLVIKDGNFLVENMKKIGYSIDNILQMLREKDVFDPAEVDLAVIEADGALSVLKKISKQTVTKEDLTIQPTGNTISFPVIIEGNVYKDSLNYLNLDEEWLRQQLSQHGIIDYHQIFYASVNQNQALHISLTKEPQTPPPPIRH